MKETFDVKFKFSNLDKMAELRSAILETYIKELYDVRDIFFQKINSSEIECSISFKNKIDQIHWMLSNIQ